MRRIRLLPRYSKKLVIFVDEAFAEPLETCILVAYSLIVGGVGGGVGGEVVDPWE